VSRGAEGMHTGSAPMYPWHPMGWAKMARQGLQRQKRIYRAATRAEHRPIRRRQHLWRRSRAVTRRAVRHVTQAHQGQQTPGVAGVAHLTPPARRELVKHLHREGTASPVHRVASPKPGTTEPRPLGMPTRADRAQPRWVTPAVDPAGAAPFAPHSSGVRPGRRTWEASGAL
jgi:RNA-directed DNA polymerase